MMLFGSRTPGGLEVITVKDYYRKKATFHFRPIREDESLEYYFECVMNYYWLHIGKNKRKYYD